jgi:hypothetical protein
MQRLSSQSRRHLVAPLRGMGTALCAVLACVALVACGGGSSSTAASGAGSKSANQESSRLKLRQCLREHGANVPESGGAGAAQNIPQATFQAAIQACRKYATGAFGNAPSASQQVQIRDKLVKYASCMRENGLQIADPTSVTGGGPGGSGFFSELQKLRQNPNFTAANAKCQKNLPNGGKGAPGGAGGPGGPGAPSGAGG